MNSFTIGERVRLIGDDQFHGTVLDLTDGETTEGRTVLVEWAPGFTCYEYRREVARDVR